MMANLISEKEMIDLTGAKTANKQCEVLRNNGIGYTLRADGRPALSWEAYNRQVVSRPKADVSPINGPRLGLV